jgi:His/Glu/Gln/Arg/opine family amino acid ABC transporter permease subunit
VDFDLIARSMPKLLDGAVMTLFLTAISVSVGFCLAIPIALAKLSRRYWLRVPASLFIYVFRGTPLLIQLFLIYYGLGQFRLTLEEYGLWWFFRDAINCALLVLILNTGAYSGEIFRGAIAGVASGQIEAARAVGMSWLTQTRRIVLPQALRIGWPAYTNEVVFLMQATSLVSLVTVTELFRSSQIIAARTFDIYSMYLTAAAMYLVISYGIIFVFGLAERHLMRHRAPVAQSGIHKRAFAVLSR